MLTEAEVPDRAVEGASTRFAPGDAWQELKRRSPLLAWTGVLHLALLGVTIGLIAIDDRTLLGLNVWVKPAKFMASIGIYLLTVAWLIGDVRAPRWLKRIVAVGIAFAMTVETVILFTQSIRGTTSHFNVTTALDGSLFGMMGTMIAVDTVLMVVLLLAFLRPHPTLAPAYVWGIRIGIAIFLVGGWVGGQMIANMAHTMGGPDGGPGLPLLNWSTTHGDLRIAHAMGLHALQVFPFTGWFLTRRDHGNEQRGVLVLGAMALLYTAALLWLFTQARAGIPLIGA